MNNAVITGLQTKPQAIKASNASYSIDPGESDGESVDHQEESFLKSKLISLDLNTIGTCHPLPRREETDEPAIIKQRKHLKGSAVYLNDHLTRRNADYSNLLDLC